MIDLIESFLPVQETENCVVARLFSSILDAPSYIQMLLYRSSRSKSILGHGEMWPMQKSCMRKWGKKWDDRLKYFGYYLSWRWTLLWPWGILLGLMLGLPLVECYNENFCIWGIKGFNLINAGLIVTCCFSFFFIFWIALETSEIVRGLTLIPKSLVRILALRWEGGVFAGFHCMWWRKSAIVSGRWLGPILLQCLSSGILNGFLWAKNFGPFPFFTFWLALL